MYQFKIYIHGRYCGTIKAFDEWHARCYIAREYNAPIEEIRAVSTCGKFA